MATATQRITINKPTYMKIDGQWVIVYPGSVIDLDATQKISPSCCDPTFSEAAGTLKPHNGTTPVRNLRTR